VASVIVLLFRQLRLTATRLLGCVPPDRTTVTDVPEGGSAAKPGLSIVQFGQNVQYRRAGGAPRLAMLHPRAFTPSPGSAIALAASGPFDITSPP